MSMGFNLQEFKTNADVIVSFLVSLCNPNSEHFTPSFKTLVKGPFSDNFSLICNTSRWFSPTSAGSPIFLEKI